MLFNSKVFLLFFIVVYTLYLLARRSSRAQNRLLLVASYVFYGWWDWRFLSLLMVSTVVDYFVGLALPKATDPRRRRALLITSLMTNLGLLGFFKYFNFFADSFSRVLGTFGMGATGFDAYLKQQVAFLQDRVARHPRLHLVFAEPPCSRRSRWTRWIMWSARRWWITRAAWPPESSGRESASHRALGALC